jgi:hypothetical protein
VKRNISREVTWNDYFQEELGELSLTIAATVVAMDDPAP